MGLNVPFLFYFGLIMAFGGSLVIYLASPNQGLLSQSWPSRPANVAGALLIAGGFFVLSQPLLVATAIFVLSVWVMLLLAALPFVASLLKHLKGADH